MSEHNVAGPNESVDRNLSLLRILVAGLIKGTKHAQAYAEWQDEELDRVLAPALVRKGVKRFLMATRDEVPLDIEEDEGSKFDPEYLPNLGLSVVGESGDCIRILKSDNDNLPPPGPSRKRRAFYAQQGELFRSAPEGKNGSKPSPLNLVLHWVVDREYRLTRVYLACPKAGGDTRASVESYWDEVIWRNVVARESTSQAEAKADELNIYPDVADEESGDKE